MTIYPSFSDLNRLLHLRNNGSFPKRVTDLSATTGKSYHSLTPCQQPQDNENVLVFQAYAFSTPVSTVQSRRQASDLKSVLAEKIPAAIEDVKAFRKQHGNTKVGEITVDMVSGLELSRDPKRSPKRITF